MFPKFLFKRPFRDQLRVAITNEIRLLQLKPVKRIHFKFDPFHPRVVSIRY